MGNNQKKSMWGGRFSENTDDFLVQFGASLDVDIELLDVDIEGSIAWVEALVKAGILTGNEMETLILGLRKVGSKITADIQNRTFAFDRSLEDVHMTVEAALVDMVGPVGAKLHTGRSRNDQVALDERLYLVRALDALDSVIHRTQETIVALAERHVDAILPSYTHLQQAQPVRLGHYLMTWFWMLARDRERFIDARKRTDVMPLGSGAVSGTGFEIDRDFLAAKLGFSHASDNSIDAVSDRDYIIETLAAGSVLMMHLSRISEDLIIWSSSEFGFVSLPDRYSTGSSMMPQKKNPDSLELVRGKTGRVYGNLMAILTVMKGLPFSYCKDMQEDKEPLFDTLATIVGSLRILDGVLSGLAFREEGMEAAVDMNIFATDVADYLTRKGMPFRTAHEVTGLLVKYSVTSGTPLAELPLEVFREHSDLFGGDVRQLFDLRMSADRRSSKGGTGRTPLLVQIAHAKAILAGRDAGGKNA